jgi:hypothetical protein
MGYHRPHKQHRDMSGTGRGAARSAARRRSEAGGCFGGIARANGTENPQLLSAFVRYGVVPGGLVSAAAPKETWNRAHQMLTLRYRFSSTPAGSG